MNFSREVIYKLFSKIDNIDYVDLDEIRLNQTNKEILDYVKKYQNTIQK
ncbi:MAG: hypothetical protein LBD88_01825 [Candidatus Peribacteria bacterium]|nr:hypothetical protein [Candidatus Peribacteria bacterium]